MALLFPNSRRSQALGRHSVSVRRRGAGTNERMIYVCFGDKDKLFDAVLERRIVALAEAVPIIPVYRRTSALSPPRGSITCWPTGRCGVWRRGARSSVQRP